MTTEITLEPCPYCGEEEPVVLMPLNPKKRLYQVVCRACMSRGPEDEDYEKSKLLWNLVAEDPCIDCTFMKKM